MASGILLESLKKRAIEIPEKSQKKSPALAYGKRAPNPRRDRDYCDL